MSSEFDFFAATADELQILDRELDAFNDNATGLSDRQSIGISVRDRAGRMVGGLKGVTALGWLYVSNLWLDEGYRGQGLGSDLLRRAERQAVARGCRRSCLSSFSFQAPDFYLRHGYEVFGQLEDYPDGETLFFLRKALA
ncbi:MAG: GNAT family N-acetyltransferase [Gammaproteobacteria bacterium]|nr:MAG: GNAT family N-acetyltransferase [Gammaproteobacteria bacterium]